MTRLFRRFGAGLLRDIAHLVLGAGASQVVLLLGTPFVLKAHGAAGFGKYAIVLSISSVVVAFATLRIDNVIPVAETRHRALRLVAAMIGIMVFVTVVECLTLTAAAWLDLRWVTGSTQGLDLWWVPAIAFSQGAYTALRALMMRCSAFKRASQGQLLRAAVFLVLALSLAGAAPAARVGDGECLLAAQFFADMTGCCWFYFGVRRGARRLLLAVPPTRAIAALRANRSLIGATTSSYLLVVANQNLPIWTVGYVFGAQEAGWLAASFRIVVAPTQFVIGTVGVAFTQRLRAKRSKDLPVSGDVVWLVGILALLLLPVSGLLVWIAESGKLALLGQDWSGASTTLSAMVAIAIGSIAYSAVEGLPLLFRLSRFIIGYQAVKLALIVVACGWALVGGVAYLPWIRGYAALETVLYLSNAALTLLTVRRVERAAAGRL